MCTLTFVPKNSGFILTSSRDELFSRATISPRKYEIFDQTLIFPKDEEIGGSWLVMGEHLLICLLNGSEKEPVLKEQYEQSRGNLVLQRFRHKSTNSFLENESFEEFPPFTMVIFDFNNDLGIEEISWNGRKKSLEQFNKNVPKIWSSATLYNDEQRTERKNWFEDFLKNESNLSQEHLLDFHQKKHTENSSKNILMKRENGKQTTSISQIIVNEKMQSFFHKDLLKQTNTNILWKEKEMDLPLL